MVAQHLMKAKVTYNTHIYIVYLVLVPAYHVTLSSGSQAAVAYTSVGKAFFTSAGIFSYHIYTRHTNKSKVQYMKCGSQLQYGNKYACHINNSNDNPGSHACHPAMQGYSNCY